MFYPSVQRLRPKRAKSKQGMSEEITCIPMSRGKRLGPPGRGHLGVDEGLRGLRQEGRLRDHGVADARYAARRKFSCGRAPSMDPTYVKVSGCWGFAAAAADAAATQERTARTDLNCIVDVEVECRRRFKAIARGVR